MWLSGSQGILYIFLQRKRLHIRLYVYAGVLQKHSLMVTASMAGLMMPVSSMAVLAGLCATGNAAGIMGMAAHVCTTGNAAGIMGMAAHVCTTGNAAGVMGMAAHVCATGNAAGIMGMAAHVRASGYAAVMIPMSVIRRVGIAVLAVVHVSGCFGTSRNVAGAVAVFTGLCTSVNAAKSVCMRGFQSASRYAAVVIPMTVIRRVGIAVLAVVHVGGCFGTSRNAAGAVAVFTGLCTAVNAAKSVYMRGFQSASCNAAVVIPMSVIRRMGIAVLAVVHVSGCFGTSRNIAGAVAVFTGLCTAVDAAKSVCVCGFQSAACNTAVMIPMSVICGVGIAVLAVVHVGGCFGTTRNAAGAVAVFTGLCTAVDAAKSVCVCGFQSAACNTAVMIPMSVICGVGIAVLAVVHVGGCFGTTRNAAGAVAVFTGLCTAVDAAKSVLVYFRLRTTCHFAGNACSIFLCRSLDFRGTLIYRIGDNTACHHGNGYKRNG